jgi:hypothetical protein
MTPQGKAKELIDKFDDLLTYKESKTKVKQCALIAVDEIINSEPRKPSNVDWDEVGATHQYYYEAQIEEAKKFWQEVKQEIEKL